MITGAASGIGLGIADRFAKEGARIVICDIADEAGQAAAQALRDGGAQALFVHHDAGDEESWRAAIQGTVSHFGALNILINNAYSGGVHTIQDASLQDQLNAFRVTAHGVFLGVKLAGPAMADGGSIVNISSIAGYRASPSNAVYSAAKSAARALSRAAALDLAPRGIRVNIVAPGIVHTPSLISTVRTLFNASTDEAVEEGLDKLRKTVPLGMIAQPIEIANAALFLCSSDAAFITGADLIVDGGAMLR
jgi:NAD(P)-dependent dehydrogenase (short-subunit alcohol dehydrogenase family)